MALHCLSISVKHLDLKESQPAGTNFEYNICLSSHTEDNIMDDIEIFSTVYLDINMIAPAGGEPKISPPTQFDGQQPPFAEWATEVRNYLSINGFVSLLPTWMCPIMRWTPSIWTASTTAWPNLTMWSRFKSMRKYNTARATHWIIGRGAMSRRRDQ